MKEQYYELIKMYEVLCKPLPIGLERIRQHYLEESYYHKFLDDRRSDMLMVLEEFNNNPEATPFWYFQSVFVELIILHYTRGVEFSTLVPMLAYVEQACIVYNHEAHSAYLKKFPTFDCIHLEEHILTNISLFAIFKRSKYAQLLLNTISSEYKDDKLVTHLFHYYLDPAIALSLKRYSSVADRNKDFLVKAILADDEKEVLQNLNKYLANWYSSKAKKHSFFYNSHTPENINQGNYIGYWSFETALVAIEKNIDDSSLHQYLYYPKDLVEYVRNNPVQDQ